MMDHLARVGYVAFADGIDSDFDYPSAEDDFAVDGFRRFFVGCVHSLVLVSNNFRVRESSHQNREQ